jgi:hypothetical protein
MTGCRAGCLHRALVHDYRAERARQEHAAEHHSRGYLAELAEYLDARPLITFRDWLGWMSAAAQRQMEVAA